MNANTLYHLGWRPCFEQQLSCAESDRTIVSRVGAHLGSQILCLTGSDELLLPTQLIETCGDVKVGDWLLLDVESHRGIRRLERESLIARKAAGEKVQSQLIAANIDTLFILGSCNHDFNLGSFEQ